MARIVRGSKLIVVAEPPGQIAQKAEQAVPFGAWRATPDIGDHLSVASRKKNGWLRVKNQRTGRITNLRVGPWIMKRAPGGEMPSPSGFNETASAVSFNQQIGKQLVCEAPPSDMDLEVRKSQVHALEVANQKLLSEKLHMTALKCHERERADAMTDRCDRERERADAMAARVDELTHYLEEAQQEKDALHMQIKELQTAYGELSQAAQAYRQAHTGAAEAYHRRVQELETEIDQLKAKNQESLDRLRAWKGEEDEGEEIVMV